MSPCRSTMTLAIAGLAFACTTPPPPPVELPVDANSGVIGIKVAVDKLGSTERAYFVRLDDGDPLARPYVIQANYFEDGYVYLLNARPGRYAAVAASNRRKAGTPSEYIVYFPAQAIEQTIVELEPGRVAFMGDWALVTPWMPGMGTESDAAQTHYSKLLMTRGSGFAHYPGSVEGSDHSDAALMDFLANAHKRLARLGWSEAIEATSLAGTTPVASGMPSLSALRLKCNKPFYFERDCSMWKGPNRPIQLQGFAGHMAGTADGHVVIVMYPAVSFARAPGRAYDAVQQELARHDVGVTRVTAVKILGKIRGYILELDGDGYSVLEQLGE